MKMEEISYRELQVLCKDKGLSARGSKEELIKRLKEAEEPGEKEEKKEEAEEEAEEALRLLKEEADRPALEVAVEERAERRPAVPPPTAEEAERPIGEVLYEAAARIRAERERDEERQRREEAEKELEETWKKLEEAKKKAPKLEVEAMVGQQEAKLSWNEVPDAVKYRIHREDLPQPRETELRFLHDTGLRNGRSYFYQVEALGRRNKVLASWVGHLTIPAIPEKNILLVWWERFRRWILSLSWVEWAIIIIGLFLIIGIIVLWRIL